MIKKIKELRDKTMASVSDCKKALDDAEGDMAKACELLKKRGLEIAAKKASRAANQGRIEAYVHTGNKIGVVVEVNCETDFVARNEEFIRFTKDIAMQIAACAPLYVNREQVPSEALKEVKESHREEYFKTLCLMEQPFIRDPKQSIKDVLTATVARIGENIVVRRFCRFKIGEL